MVSSSSTPEPKVRRSERFTSRPGYVAIGVALAAWAAVGFLTVQAQQVRTVTEGVYTNDQAKRGQATYSTECAVCHGATLAGELAPPLTGDAFMGFWAAQPLSDLVTKIQSTMPASDPGKLNRAQAAELVAHILQVGKFPAGQAELSTDEGVLKQITFPAASSPSPAASAAASVAPLQAAGNLAQMMRGILFPSSNLIFNVQNTDPGEQKKGWQPGDTPFSWADWGAGIYSGWELVDYAAIAIAESAPLIVAPGRRCENGKPAPVENADWIKWTKELSEAGRTIYKISQTRNRDAVIEATNLLADSCFNCHDKYRDKPGGTAQDPSNKAARCTP